MAGSRDFYEEQQIIARILGGDKQLFHALIRPYERSVYVMALSFLHNEADAEEIAQEAFLKAFRNLASFRGDAKFGTWLISITLNEARSRLRRKGAVQMESLDRTPEEIGHVSPKLLRDWKEIPSEALERQEVRLMLHEAISSLPPIYREVFMLRDVEELSTSEAAEILNVSVASIKVRLYRARMMLQKALAPQLKHSNLKRGWRRWFWNANTSGPTSPTIWIARSTARRWMTCRDIWNTVRYARRFWTLPAIFLSSLRMIESSSCHLVSVHDSMRALSRKCWTANLLNVWMYGAPPEVRLVV